MTHDEEMLAKVGPGCWVQVDGGFAFYLVASKPYEVGTPLESIAIVVDEFGNSSTVLTARVTSIHEPCRVPNIATTHKVGTHA